MRAFSLRHGYEPVSRLYREGVQVAADVGAEVAFGDVGVTSGLVVVVVSGPLHQGVWPAGGEVPEYRMAFRGDLRVEIADLPGCDARAEAGEQITERIDVEMARVK